MTAGERRSAELWRAAYAYETARIDVLLT